MTLAVQTSPAISVVMSCYNAEKWLSESVTSVLTQSFADLELIAINDGSQDSTGEILDRYSEQDRRVRVIHQQNTGLTRALNVGIDHARGHWIARMDADDISVPERLEKQMALAAKDPQTVFVGSGTALLDERGNPLGTYKYPQDPAALLRNLIHAKRFPAHSSALFRAETARRLQGYRPALKRAQDVDLWLRLSEVGRLYCHPDPLVQIRKHSDQVSNLDGNRQTRIAAVAARTSYWLRRAGAVDPLDGPDIDSNRFRDWTEQQMIGYRVFERERMFRKAARSHDGAVARPNPLKSLLTEPRLFAAGVHARLRGDTLPRKLARAWQSGSGMPDFTGSG